MANITASDVKELREMTGCGMMDCKRALVEADGNRDEAVKILREKGLAKAAKKAGRIAAEGIVKAKVNGTNGVIVEINCETDFCAKSDKFLELVETITDTILTNDAADVEALKNCTIAGGAQTVSEYMTEKIATIGENMNIRRFAKVSEENGIVVSYIHAGGKIGVLVDVETDVVNDAIKEMAKNVAMQAAALKPQYTTRAEVDADYISREKEILLAQIMNDPKESQKPQKVIDGMINGRINKELKEICLMDQTYVKAEDGKQTVSAYVAQVAKENNAKVAVKNFVRFETGEGMEKKNEDFAAEVAAQMAAAK
mgnify:CR=1 FL=1